MVVWEVTGMEHKGGIIVREGKDLTSSPLSNRLSFGAMVEDLKIDGDRMQYKIVTGTGPETGWTTIELPERNETWLTKTNKTPDEARTETLVERARKKIAAKAEEYDDNEMLNKYCTKYTALGYPAKNPTFRIFFFHGAGCTESIWTNKNMEFFNWAKEDAGLELVAPSYPGRDKTQDIKNRITAAPAMAKELLYTLYSKLTDGVPFAFVAHSVGCWVSFELLMEMKKIEIAMPRIVLMNSFAAPNMPTADRPWKPCEGMKGADLQEEAKNWDSTHFEGPGAMIFDDEENMWTKVYKPLLTADFKLFDEYKFKHEVSKFSFPIRSYWMPNEHYITKEMQEGWKDWTDDFELYDGPENAGHLTCCMQKDLQREWFSMMRGVMEPFC